jgi:hypothetical protein
LKTRVEYLRAETNSLLVENLQEYELARRNAWKASLAPGTKPGTTRTMSSLKARDRREEIKEEIEALQQALTRDPQRDQTSRHPSKGRSSNSGAVKRRPKAAKIRKKYPT